MRKEQIPEVSALPLPINSFINLYHPCKQHLGTFGCFSHKYLNLWVGAALCCC